MKKKKLTHRQLFVLKRLVQGDIASYSKERRAWGLIDPNGVTDISFDNELTALTVIGFAEMFREGDEENLKAKISNYGKDWYQEEIVAPFAFKSRFNLDINELIEVPWLGVLEMEEKP